MVCELWFADPCSSLLDKRSHGGIDLKMKTIILPTKWACSGIAENCNSEPASYAKTTGVSSKGEDCNFLEKEEVGRGCFEGKSIGVQGDDGVSLAEAIESSRGTAQADTCS